MRDWADILDAAAGAGSGPWIDLPSNGWGALVAYLAGPGRVRALQRERPTVTTTSTGIDGIDLIDTQPATAADLAMMDRFVDAYLVEHEVPPCPPGLAFQLRVPPPFEWEELVSKLNQAVLRDAADGSPLAERDAMRRVLDEAFGQPHSVSE